MKEKYSSSYKTVSLWLIFASLLLFGYLTAPASAANGPKTPNMLVRVYPNLKTQMKMLDKGTIDIAQAVLTKEWIDTWIKNPSIVMKDYSEIAQTQIEINNQRWPTGVTDLREYDPLSDSWKHYYGSNEPWDSKAKEFRKAIAYLADKEGWKNRILNGYGICQETAVPVPALAGYTDYPDLESKGLIYHYNTVKAAQILDAAGFTQGTTKNPRYDSTTPGSAQYLRIDPRYGGDLQPLYFYIRIDDDLRRDLGREFTAQLRKAGIQVNPIYAPREVCFNNVMVLYDYHLYTGGWIYCADIPDQLYFAYHSSQYHGGTLVGYYGGVGWSPNYVGFCDTQNDGYLNTCKYSGDFQTIKQSILDTQEREAELVHVIPAYSRIGVKAYRAGWTGVINMAGWGIDNRWSFLNMASASDTTIDWGICGSLNGMNPVTAGRHPSLCTSQAEFWYDWKIFDLVYDPMIGLNPYDLSQNYGFAAEYWEFNPVEKWALFRLRGGLTFHSGALVTPDDVKFSLEFTKACGPGVAWSYSEVEAIDHVNTKAEEPALGLNDVKVYFREASYWAMHWAGYQYILDHNIWMAANAQFGWGYTRGMTDFNAFTNRMLVRSYNPWNNDVDYDGIVDLKEDGSGPWIFQSYAPTGPVSMATTISLTAFNNYIIPQTGIFDYLKWSFHMIGDVDYNGIIDTEDGSTIKKAMGTDKWSYPWGTDWDQYNPDADINYGTWDMINHMPLVVGDGFINYLDLGKWGIHFGTNEDP